MEGLRAANRQYADATAKLDLLCDSIGIGTLELDYTTKTVKLDAVARKLYDLPSGEFPNVASEDLLSRVHPDDRSAITFFAAQRGEVQSSLTPPAGADPADGLVGDRLSTKFRVRRRDVSVKHIRYEGGIIIFEGQCLGVRGILLDGDVAEAARVREATLAGERDSARGRSLDVLSGSGNRFCEGRRSGPRLRTRYY